MIKFRTILIIVTICHLIALSYQIRKVIELNIKQSPSPIKVQFIDQSDNEEKTFVDTESSGVEVEVDTPFISDKTQKVDEQTVKKPSQGTPQVKDGGGVNSKESKATNKPSQEISFKDLSISSTDSIKQNINQDLSEKNSSKGNSSESGPLGDIGSQLIIDENIKESDKTSLNTIQTKYSSFYRRMNQQVENSWVPQINSLGNTFASGEYETKVLLKINEQGEIIGLKLDRESGYKELDTIGINTFKKIRIFQNPPSEVFNGKEYFYLTWSLRLKVGR